jgi:hypothetical protein
MDEKVKVLIEKTGCTQNQAEQVLKSVSGNIKEAFNLIKNLGKKNTIVVKGKFKGKETNTYGLVIFILNKAKKSLDHVRALVSYNLEIYKVSIRDRWDIFDREITRLNLREKEKVHRQSLKLKSGLKENFINNKIRGKYFKYLKELDLENFKNYLAQNIGNIIKDRKIEMEVEVDNLTSFTSFGIRLKEIDEERKEEKEEKKEEAKIILKVSPIIAPVSGIKVTELKSGDNLLIYIIDKTDLGIYLGELMGAIKNDRLIPIVTEITEIEKIEDEKLKIMVKIGEGVFGEAHISEEVNVVKLHSEQDDKEGDLLQTKNGIGKERVNLYAEFFIILALIFLLLFLMVLK